MEVLTNEINDLLKRQDIKQKELAIDTEIPETTLSGYIKQGIPFEKALKILDVSGDSLFTSQLAYNFLGFIKSMDGKLANTTAAELDIFQKIESDERKEHKKRAERLIVENKVRELDLEELNEIEQYGLEFLDEIIVELAIVYKIFGAVNLDIREAVETKMPEWISKNYMKEG
ncbi:putative uncharacterized protein [Tetragenococcus halophilus subsp. halophilus]|uniref:hypothetical protein n=1 Tax=Tetragenococcus halophilus TaxID=51669 RepID=UPI000CC1DC3C|nr:hypothetical protein [Tetragenococcus halophilus]GBD73872.1 putative uncharacterized protein [Tetragenococcus halophilus subsp. halophilus]GBD76292.1 putative uncharacterized protein [Tetragenococcus halophilus subsp. halophilus]